jgi:hypothetical protein
MQQPSDMSQSSGIEDFGKVGSQFGNLDKMVIKELPIGTILGRTRMSVETPWQFGEINS